MRLGLALMLKSFCWARQKQTDSAFSLRGSWNCPLRVGLGLYSHGRASWEVFDYLFTLSRRRTTTKTTKTMRRPIPLLKSGSADSYKLIARTIMATAQASLPMPQVISPKPTDESFELVTSYIRLD